MAYEEFIDRNENPNAAFLRFQASDIIGATSMNQLIDNIAFLHDRLTNRPVKIITANPITMKRPGQENPLAIDIETNGNDIQVAINFRAQTSEHNSRSLYLTIWAQLDTQSAVQIYESNVKAGLEPRTETQTPRYIFTNVPAGEHTITLTGRRTSAEPNGANSRNEDFAVPNAQLIVEELSRAAEIITV